MHRGRPKRTSSQLYNTFLYLVSGQNSVNGSSGCTFIVAGRVYVGPHVELRAIKLVPFSKDSVDS